MAVARADILAALELFSPLDVDLTHRPMMGGEIFHADGTLFAALMPGAGVHLRAKGDLAGRLAAAGARQFLWHNPKTGADQPMGYWSLPEAALDDPEAACDWARQALNAGD